MRLQLVVRLVVVTPDRGVLESAVHPLHLAVCPRMIGLGEPVLDAMCTADLVEPVDTPASCWTVAVLGQLGELDAIVGQHRVRAVRTGGDQRLEKGASRGSVGLRVQLGKGIFGRPIDGHEEVKPALFGPHFGDVDVEEADG